MENNDELIARIEALEEKAERIEPLEGKVEKIDRRTRSQGRDLDLNSLASIAFLAVTLIVLISIRFSYGGLHYEVDLTELANLLSVPAFCSIAAAVAAWVMKQNKDDQ